MARKNAYLLPGQFLLEGDYMVSSNGVFYAILQGDGNFVVYPGSGPDDRQGGALWASGYHDKPAGGSFSLEMQGDGNLVMYANPGVPVWATGTSGNNYALMQQDGEFVLYAGAPGQGGGRVWGSNVRWQRNKMEISEVQYDVARGTLTAPQVADTFEQYYDNDTPVEQHQTIVWEVSYEETKSWSSSLGGSVGVSAELKGGVPVVSEGKIAISASATFNTTVGEESRTTESLTGELPLTIPPFSTVEATSVVSVSGIAVPYAAKVKYLFDNGATISTTTTGIFTGSTKYRLDTGARTVAAARAKLAAGPLLRAREAARPTALAAR